MEKFRIFIQVDALDGIYRWGIVGQSTQAEAFARAISDVVDARLEAAVISKESTTRTYLEGATRVYETYEDMVLDERVQLVYIASPIALRMAHIKAALSLRKGVVYQPPLQATLKGLDSLFKEATRKQTLLLEGLDMCFLPHIQRLSAVIAQGVIGEVLSIQADANQHILFDPEHIFFNEKEGGIIYQHGLQPLALVAHFLGSPEQLAGYLQMDVTGIDTQYALVMHYPKGVVALLGASGMMHGTCEAHIVGNKSRVHIHAPFYGQTEVSMYTQGRRSGLMKFTYPSNACYYTVCEAQRCYNAEKVESPLWTHTQTRLLSRLLSRCRKELVVHRERV